MKNFSYLLLVCSALALISTPARAERYMSFKRDLELKANNGFDDTYLTTEFRDSRHADDSAFSCFITKLTKIGEQPTIAAGREVEIKQTEGNDGVARFQMYNKGKVSGVLATIACRGEDPIGALKNTLGLELADPAIRRVPIRYEAAKPEVQEQEAKPQLIQPVYEQEEAAKSETSEL